MNLAPDWSYPLGAFEDFDWASIGADIVSIDAHGPAVVEWGGHQWTRRSGSGKFGKAIWFSRAAGKDEHGETRYMRLIRFRDQAEPEPLDQAVARTVTANGKTQASSGESPPGSDLTSNEFWKRVYLLADTYGIERETARERAEELLVQNAGSRWDTVNEIERRLKDKEP
jgi:hypothetical protein